jgi:acyl-CoA synthetase (AMP-forming)/AMP-acid ligase II
MMPDSVPPPFSSSDTVFASIARHARAAPDKAAVISANRSLSYADLANQASRVAAALRARNLRPGDRVVVETDNNIDHLVGMIGAMAAGAIAVALPTDRQSYRAVCNDAEPAVVLGVTQEEELGGDMPSCPRILVADLILRGDGKPDWSMLERSVRPGEIAMLYYTSGTSSGVRKGVMQSYAQLHNTVHYITHVMRMDASVVEFVASPTDNAFWFGRCRCVLHVAGAVLLSNGPLNPFGVISAINRHNGNAIAGDTAVFMLLLHHMEKHLLRLAPSIKWVKIASAPMPFTDKRRIMEMLPEARIVFNYGLTEAMRTCLNVFRDNPDKLGSVGRPSPSVRLRIVDTKGRDAKTGEAGEVLIAGGNLASGYWKKDEMWASRCRDGWYHSGDLGYLDEDGFLYLRDRVDHAINSGGKTIALSEVENCLRPFFKRTTFVTCGMNDPKGVLGDVVVLGIEAEWREPVPWSEMRIRLFEAMEPLMVPISAYLVPEFPRTSNQKVQLNQLRKAIEAGRYPAL